MHRTFQSPFSWRYGSPAMRAIWSETHKRRLWRRVWLALAQAQSQMGLVTPEQLADLQAHADQVDVAKALAIETEIGHDLMAELQAFAAQCPVGGGIIHLGATSADIEDNADALRLREALDLILQSLRGLLAALAHQILRWADLPTMGFTHLQPAEPTTVGYRLAQYAQDLLTDLEELTRVRQNIKGKGFKGAVGTSASYRELPGLEGELEARAMSILGLEAWPVTTQVYPRKQDWLVLNALAGLAASLYKFAFDLRLLQSPPLGEWSEPFGARQVGSSAMPFKRNPVQAEKIDGLARYLAQLPRVAWDNAAHSLLERTLDDSANRRVILAEAFLCADELLLTAKRLIEGLEINQKAVARNLAAYGLFAATERVLMAAVHAGADRQVMHQILRQHSLAAWQDVAAGNPNPLQQLLISDDRITRYVPPDRLPALLDASTYVGDAPARAKLMAELIRKAIGAAHAGAAGTTTGENGPDTN